MSGLVLQFSPAVGSALLLSMGYIDVGKWVATIKGGPLFGPSLALLLFFNCSAILCQHLANCIGLVVGKNLAQICCEEYPRSTCILLGILAELSVIVSDLTKILGVAHVFNQLFELDLFSCICFSATVALLVPFFSPSGSYMLNVLYVSISAFTLLFYVLAVLLSQPEASAIAHNRHCGLDWETVCGIMSLLGAHIMPHNFYVHSSIAQDLILFFSHNYSSKHSRQSDKSTGRPHRSQNQKVFPRWCPKEACRPDIDEAPEFNDTINYIASISQIAEKYGICRIIPPPSWKPPCPLKEDSFWRHSKFATRVHQVDKLQNREPMKKSRNSRQRRRKRRKRLRFGRTPDALYPVLLKSMIVLLQIQMRSSILSPDRTSHSSLSKNMPITLRSNILV